MNIFSGNLRQMKSLCFTLCAALLAVVPLTSSEVRLELRLAGPSIDALARCDEGTHRMVWQATETLGGPWRSVGTSTVTNGLASLSLSPTAASSFLRALPKPTPGFLERRGRIRDQVRESWAEAALLEAHLLVADWTEGYPDSVAVRGVFSIGDGTVTAIENAPGEDVSISISNTPWMGSQVMQWPIAMELDIAESRLQEAGFGSTYRTLTLRQPVYPGMVEPYWIFGTRSGFVFVGSKSKSVKQSN
jgi:hypothetical protein